jgi:putative glycosyltransferase (TIGR04348 family)
MTIIHLITPALAEANNGNWQTAYRWGKFLSKRHQVQTSKQWQASSQHDHTSVNLREVAVRQTSSSVSAEMMIALHARRSAPSIAAFALTGQPIVLVMTGTDLYRDIHTECDAQRSLELADRLVVLHELGADDLPQRFRSKTRTIFQSARKLIPVDHARHQARKRFFDVILVGHIRAEKDPLTALRAIQMMRAGPIPASSKITRLLHVGSDKDESLGQHFRDVAATLPEVVLKGSQPNAVTRQLIKTSDLLVLPSIMEGGANVLIEAVMAGVPVIASHISGSVGMLGADYQGFFEVGNAQGLATLLARCRDEPNFIEQLRKQCDQRSKLFEPASEERAVNLLVDELIS